MDTSDKALVRLALKGNKDAFSILVARYQKSLKIFLANYCPVPEDIDDICQESLRKAYQSLPSYDPKYSFNRVSEIVSETKLFVPVKILSFAILRHPVNTANFKESLSLSFRNFTVKPPD